MVGEWGAGFRPNGGSASELTQVRLALAKSTRNSGGLPCGAAAGNPGLT